MQAMKNLKIYDPDPERRFARAKLARQNEELRENGVIVNAVSVKQKCSFRPRLKYVE